MSEHIEQSEERERRLARVNELREAGRDPFLIERYERTHTAQEVTADSASHWTLPEEESKTLSYRLAGRVTSQRSKGKTAFYDLRDGSGRIQLYIRKDDLGDEAFEDCLALDLGDIIGVEGFPFKTRTGEPSIHVKTVTLLSKPLRAVPFGKIDPDGKVHSGLSNVEDRYRYRYLDLLVNPEAKDILTKRCQIVSAMRRFLDGEDFLEVETPTLQEVAGGAAARPFMTHHNALKHDFKLRIS
ncbi:MAG: OB-fold nucleic acid binding domain-containing protein, partial [Armatimonadetes bacterium]|nr:OB-fold nucleic acid binding domain-containing protein [Armatimonadota bacterium]